MLGGRIAKICSFWSCTHTGAPVYSMNRLFIRGNSTLHLAVKAAYAQSSLQILHKLPPRPIVASERLQTFYLDLSVVASIPPLRPPARLAALKLVPKVAPNDAEVVPPRARVSWKTLRCWQCLKRLGPSHAERLGGVRPYLLSWARSEGSGRV